MRSHSQNNWVIQKNCLGKGIRSPTPGRWSFMIRAGVRSAGRGHSYEARLVFGFVWDLYFYFCVYLSWNRVHGIPVIKNWGRGGQCTKHCSTHFISFWYLLRSRSGQLENGLYFHSLSSLQTVFYICCIIFSSALKL